MTTSPPAPGPVNSRGGLFVWSAVAAIGGVAAFVLPPLVSPAAAPAKAYGHPVLPWLASAYANIRFLPTMGEFLALGVVLGIAQPKRRLLMACLAAALLVILHAVNVVGDVSVDPSDHNLLPFEFVFLAVVAFPVLPGVFVGGLIRRSVGPAAD